MIELQGGCQVSGLRDGEPLVYFSGAYRGLSPVAD